MLSKEKIVKRIKELSPWYQRIYLVDNIYTSCYSGIEYGWDFIKNFIPKNLKEIRALDIGCNAGYSSIKMKELGTQYIKGIDFEHYIRQAKFVAKIKGYNDINFMAQSVYQLDTSEKFDLTLCLGILYHLKYPFLALKKISDVTTEMILLETEALVDEKGTDKMKFIEHSYRNDGTNWWIFGEECLKSMLRSVGFKFVKSYTYPDDHPTLGKHYYQGFTEDGIRKGKRIIVIGIKMLNKCNVGMFGLKISELEDKIDFNNLGV